MNGNKTRKQEDRSRRIRLGLIALLTCTLLAGLYVLIRYAAELISERKTEAELRETYYGSEARNQPPEEPAALFTAADPAGTDAPAAEAPAVPALPAAEAAEAAEAGGVPALPEGEHPEKSLPTGKLPAAAYPGNPNLIVTGRFRDLRMQNKDIVGWLKLDKLLDQTVVQRDNTFYMTHDAKKKENKNGAIFLDAAVSLETRPHTILLYGHNMRSGAMFGCLRNYEDQEYYRKSPFASFESMYEEGRYVIFAAGSIGIAQTERNYIGVFTMLSDRLEERRELIRALQEASVWESRVDVQPEDQLLLLVTCVDSDDRRRVVAARRLRDGESEPELLQIIADSRRDSE